ncbi:hypothetical protein B0H14DRAFT_287917 [Mycena olivaceomarginata]|nr:hypothetical protein B0H14DRAFT_287917 [Mycena olivaceomarginata]
MSRRSNHTKGRIGRSRSPPFRLPPRRRRSTHRAHQRRSLALALPRPSRYPRSLLPPPLPAPHRTHIPHHDLAQGPVPLWSSIAPELAAPAPAPTERDDWYGAGGVLFVCALTRPVARSHSLSFPPSESSSLTRAPHCAHLPHRHLLQGQDQVPPSSSPVPELAVRAPAHPERDEHDEECSACGYYVCAL